MNWIQRMNWPFLEDPAAKRVWAKAHKLYFENDTSIDAAFTSALENEGFAVEEMPS